MPYIQSNLRDTVDSKVDALHTAIIDAVKDSEDHAQIAGILNYCVTRLVLKLIKTNVSISPRYWQIALYTGVLENIKQEFYRRLASPYEDHQAKKNGDVY